MAGRPSDRMWRYVHDHVIGLSHERDDLPCQDCSYASLFPGPSGATHYLVLACADGAGSASHSHYGSQAACLGAVRACGHHLTTSTSESHALSLDNLALWFDLARADVVECANFHGVDTRQAATTLLLAVLGQDASAFGQVGDGVFVTSDGEACEPVFWPHRGEYANETVFLTSEDWLDAFSGTVSARVNEIAAITDGLQALALHYASKTAHAPFFLNLFSQLRQADDPQALSVPLNAYLRSDMIRKRTDDDVSLILATRL